MKIDNKKPGSLLLEILIVIGVVGIVIPIIAQIVVSSLNVNKWSAENKIAVDLADEVTKSLDNVSFEKWQNIYGKLKGSANHYYTAKSAGAWVINSGDETLTVNGLSYSRYFTISNVCRDNTSRAIIISPSIPPCTAGNSDDPSTQKITVTVNWTNGTIS
jgi:type II secretory pathway pseudopilin PulG